MAIDLTPETETRIRTWLERGRYADPNDVIADALEALNTQYQADLERLRALVLEGRNSPIAGELDDAMWDRIAQEADEADRLGLPISDVVQP